MRASHSPHLEVYYDGDRRSRGPCGPFTLGTGRPAKARDRDAYRFPHSAHPDQVVSAGRAVEALALSILDGHHALYKVGRRLDERGMLPLLQPGLAPQSLHDSRLGQTLDAVYDANLHTVFSAISLRAFDIYRVDTPWLHQDTTTISFYGAYEDDNVTNKGPRPTYGYSKDGRGDLKQVILSMGVSGDGASRFARDFMMVTAVTRSTFPKPLNRVQPSAWGAWSLIPRPTRRAPWGYARKSAWVW